MMPWSIRIRLLISLTSCDRRETAREKPPFGRRTRGCALCCSVGVRLCEAVLVCEALWSARMPMIAMPVAAAFDVPNEKVCDQNHTQLEIAINRSLRSFSVRAHVGALRCYVTFNFNQPRPRRSKNESLRLESAYSVCNCHNRSRKLVLQIEKSDTIVCQATGTSELFLWVAAPFQLSFRCLRGNIAAPYSVLLFEDSEATNVCDIAMNATRLKVNHESYIFASNSRFKTAPLNDSTCTLPEYSAVLQLANPERKWTLTVLLEPPLTSCWTLLLNGRRHKANDTLNIPARSNFTMRYTNCSHRRNCSEGCRGDEPSLNSESHRQASGSSAQVTAIAVGSATAAALLVLAIGVTTFFFAPSSPSSEQRSTACP